MASFAGPMFEPKDNEWRASVFHKEGAHYNIFEFKPGGAEEYLRNIEPDDMNFWLFSTSGIHGTYTTIDEIERGWSIEDGDDENWAGRELTILLVQPRIVSMSYGIIEVTAENLPLLKRRRQDSYQAVATIGADSD